ncbi:HNH endonuclease signature motif containing protein [Croceicoccus sp. YJ47]|uniref:HNH endonuclease signature motif containing protein n=1 Tax=Croceicoccus sp. YJ47 TaxID=2798724 RepID=UPI001922D850|nr:HNH endonuclease signature motif containing protein [Croceicoccus sp. YJ47]QQN73943.1 HNH endonuclease [Croceicoccus sp. YJ47]
MAASWRDDRRKTAERGYGSKWQRERLVFLDQHPLCERCEADGRVEAATVVNHRIPHKGNMKLFWDRSNWEATCKRHHDSDIQREERSGVVKGNGRDGRPTDPCHPWNRSGEGRRG